MAVQNIKIRYVVDTTDIDRANASLGKLSDAERKVKAEFDAVNISAQNVYVTINKGSEQAQKSLLNLNGTLKNIGTAVLSAFALDSVISFGKKVIELTSQFQKYEAVLTNSLGSQKEAKAQLALLTEEAIRSNFSLSELTSGYIKLVNQGFKPTVQELRQLQDLSNFTGKSFDQLIEAVLDAQQDQFIRLKDFGIKAKKQGEEVTFTFKEQSTTVKNTASDIRAYLVGLGNLQEVQGTTAAISSTLNGRLSNLGDNFDKLFVTIGNGTTGPLNSFIEAVNFSVDAITRMIKGTAKLKEELVLSEIGKAAETIKTTLDRVAKSFEDVGVSAAESQEKAVAVVRKNLQQQIVANQFLIEKVKERFAVETDEYVKLLEIQDKTVIGLQQQKEKQVEATRIERDRLQGLLDIDNAQLDALAKLSDKEHAASVVNQKDLDKEYSKQLALIQLAEQNALRLEQLARNKNAESAPTDESKAEMEKDITQKLAIQTTYNQKRVALFKQYNQQNIEELKGYNIRFQELDQERLDYLRGQEAKYTKTLSDEDQARFEIEQEYIASVKKAREDEFNETIKEINKLADAEDKADAKKKAATISQNQTLRRAAQELYQGFQNIAQQYAQNQQLQIQNDLTTNEQARQIELARYDGNKEAQAKINAKYDAEQKKLNRQGAQQQKEAALFQIGLYIAEAIVKALASAPYPANLALAAVVGGLGAAQLALAASAPLPKYATGVEMLNGEGNETSDSILLRASKGERIVTARDNRDYYPALTAIHNHHIPPEILNNMVLNYDMLQRPSQIIVNDNSSVVAEVKNMSRKMDKLKQVNINIDKNGVHAYLEKEYSKNEFANNYIAI